MNRLSLCHRRACPGDPDPKSSVLSYRDGRDKPGHDTEGRRAAATARETKLLSEPLAGVAADGGFEGYASLFNVADLGKDMVLPGAFAESLARRGAAGIRMVWQHDPAEPIGRWLALAEDGRGLRVRGRLNLAVARAREIHALMREGAIDGLSIGFRVERARTDRAGLRRLEKLDLWEISVVTFPMQPGARVAAVKRDRVRAASRSPHPSPLPQAGEGLALAIRRAARMLSSGLPRGGNGSAP
jgi:HK97 family phage prohead protease